MSPERRLDLLREALNLGAGRAAAALEELLEGAREVALSVPQSTALSTEGLCERFEERGERELCAIVSDVRGDLDASVLLVYSERECAELVGLLGPRTEGGPRAAADPFLAEALLEVGGIVSGACTAALADFLGLRLTSRLPVLHAGAPRALLERAGFSEAADLVYVEMGFQVAGGPRDGALHDGALGLVFELSAGCPLAEHLDAFLERVGP